MLIDAIHPAVETVAFGVTEKYCCPTSVVEDNAVVDVVSVAEGVADPAGTVTLVNSLLADGVISPELDAVLVSVGTVPVIVTVPAVPLPLDNHPAVTVGVTDLCTVSVVPLSDVLVDAPLSVGVFADPAGTLTAIF